MAELRNGVAARTVAVANATAPTSGNRGLEVVASQAIYRTDAVVRRAAALQAHPLTLGPRVVLNPADAQPARLSDGDIAKLTNAAGTATLPVAISSKVAPGCAWVESGYGATATLLAGRVEVTRA